MSRAQLARAAAVAALFLALGCDKKDAATTSSAPPPGPSGGPAAQAPPASPGEGVFRSNCSRCHTTTGQVASAPPAGPKGKMGGPDLAKVAADPAHTREWLINYVRDPKSVNPESKMPPVGKKLSEDDLTKLGDYLLTLK